jgi:hypothetical protein
MKREFVIAALVLARIVATPAYAQFQDRDQRGMMRPQPVDNAL